MSNLLARATEAFKSGSLDDISGISDELMGETPTDISEVEAEVNIEENTEPNDAPEGEQPEETVEPTEPSDETEQAVEATQAESDKPTEVESDIVEVAFTDHKGRRTAKVDFSDKEKLKKLVSLAYGAPKWRVERDKAQSRIQDLESAIQENKDSYGKLESAWGEGGEEGIKNVISLLAGDENALDALLDARQEERNRIAAMDPAARERWELEQERLKEKISYEKQLSALKAQQEEASAQRQQAEYQALENRAQRSYDRWNFTGKLGDEAAEQEFGNHLWTSAINLLESKGIETPNQAQMDKAFEIVHNRMAKVMNKSVETQVDKKIQKASATAEKTVASMAKKNFKSTGDSMMDRFRKDGGRSLMKDILGVK